MNIKTFIKLLENNNINFFTGIPDSQLKPLCNFLMNTYGISKKHIIAANEGNAVALAAGYHLSTGEIPCVYLQNSGIGNIINPMASLINEKVYGIPTVFVIGWRGEPDVYDEPQHIFQGEVTLKLLDVMDIDYMIIDRDTNEKELEEKFKKFKKLFFMGKSVAFVVKKDAFLCDERSKYENDNPLLREEIIKAIVAASQEDIIVSTTGKTSRELFEIREQNKQSHKYDFLTVGSMGHSSSIAMGIAINKPAKRIWCIDGDGSAMMHMGSMCVIGTSKLHNYIHVLINNGAHESVGGQPTVANDIDFNKIASGCGYKNIYKIKNKNELLSVLLEIKEKEGPIFIEIKSAIGSRKNLGRPTTTPVENKTIFMEYLKECK